MGKILYLDCSSGISGDMTVASLLDLGASRQKLDDVISSLHLEGFHYHISKKSSYSISGCDFDVHLHTPEHSRESAYNEKIEHKENDAHSHEHEHFEGNHVHSHEHSHPHEHRHLSEVYEIIDRGEMSQNTNALSKKIFRIIAEAESRAHGCSVEEVHFHEVGAIDSIVDIISAAVLIDDLGIEKCIVTKICEGSGFVKTQHGMLPIPVPAVLNIAEAGGIALQQTSTNGEMVTPTGIAIVAAIRTAETLPQTYKVLKSGVGLGKRDFGKANFLRAMLIEDVSTASNSDENFIYVVESNIDDSTPEALGFAMDRLFDAGARDVHIEPCYMKKNRPAQMLRIITDSDHLDAIEYAVFNYTSTIGLRKYKVGRTCMDRVKFSVKLPYGEVEIKKCTWKDIVRIQPEFDSVRSVAQKANLPFQKVFDDAKRKAEEMC